MASNKDMRRADLAIPYVDPPKSANDADMSSTMSSTMPMAAMFMRNRMIGWYVASFKWLVPDLANHASLGSPSSFPSRPGSPSPPSRRRLLLPQLTCRSSCPVRANQSCSTIDDGAGRCTYIHYHTLSLPTHQSSDRSLQTYFPMFLPPQVAKGTAATPPGSFALALSTLFSCDTFYYQYNELNTSVSCFVCSRVLTGDTGNGPDRLCLVE
ncbi:uncharacterized protein N7496_005160, partial [Penicillium cataractarum]